MENPKTVGALNSLVEINNERIEGYQKAFKNTEERDLKDLFSEFKQTSRKCVDELRNEINKLGGEVTVGTNASGEFFRAWMNFKSALIGKERKAILNSCEYAEEQADETYQKIRDEGSEHLSPHQLSMIKEQHKQLKADQKTIKSMQNSLAETH